MPATWTSICRNWLRRGCDPSYAAFMADQWEERKKKAAMRLITINEDKENAMIPNRGESTTGGA